MKCSRMVGAADDKIDAILQGKDGNVRKSAEGCMPCQAKAAAFEVIKFVEDRHQIGVDWLEDLAQKDLDGSAALGPAKLNTLAALPLPNAQEWQVAMDPDPDLKRIMQRLSSKPAEQEHSKEGQWQDKRCERELQCKRLEAEDGLVWWHEK